MYLNINYRLFPLIINISSSTSLEIEFLKSDSMNLRPEKLRSTLT